MTDPRSLWEFHKDSQKFRKKIIRYAIEVFVIGMALAYVIVWIIGAIVLKY